MPEISRFFGIVIRIYWDDHNPPHFHAYYGRYRAIFDIQTGKKIKGKFPKTGERIITEWSMRYKKELQEVWERFSKREPFNKIKGAD